MANTRAKFNLVKGVWTNLYTASGVAVGTACTLINPSNSPMKYAISAAEPAVGVEIDLPASSPYTQSKVDIPTAQSGLWGYCETNIAVSVQG